MLQVGEMLFESCENPALGRENMAKNNPLLRSLPFKHKHIVSGFKEISAR